MVWANSSSQERSQMPPWVQTQQSYFLGGEVGGDKDMGSLGVCRLEKGHVESLLLNPPACGTCVVGGDGGGPLMLTGCVEYSLSLGSCMNSAPPPPPPRFFRRGFLGEETTRPSFGVPNPELSFLNTLPTKGWWGYNLPPTANVLLFFLQHQLWFA